LTEIASTVGTCSAVITVTTTDGAGNATAVTYNTRIDNTAPVATVGTIAASYPTVAAAEAAALAETSATDNCPGALTETVASTVSTCNAVVTVTITDSCGNASAVTYNTNITGVSGLQISNVIPLAGRASGGQSIKLVGAFSCLSTVTMGGVSANWTYSIGTSEITVTTPAHAVGAVDIVLTPSSGSPFTKTNAFAYLPTVFTDDTLVVGVTTAKAQHIIELRNAVDALRLVAGLGLAPWTDPTLSPTSTVIKAVHITELRTNLENAAALLGYAAGSYTDPALNGLVIKRVHIEELRERLRTIAG
jgi:hypothetical protein